MGGAGAGARLPNGSSGFGLVDLATAPSGKVRPPRVADSPVPFECITREVLELNPGVPAGGNIVIGEVDLLYIRDGLVDGRWRVDQEGLRAIGRMGGPVYTRTRERFEMPQGVGAFSVPRLEWE